MPLLKLSQLSTLGVDGEGGHMAIVSGNRCEAGLRMNKVLLGTMAFIALAASASAAVLAAKPHVKASPPVVPSHDWSGFYIGINGGGFSAHQCWETVNADGVVAPPVDMGYHNATGGTVGGPIGYRRQIANSLFGLEAQGSWSDFDGQRQSRFRRRPE
ncbi:hypothetical protein [Bradyrhizobium sp. DOA1]|uniref:hypothetical protein n=1 Tax=Bradyrhizobium sp. DOA1 TaxID=1126616 RepID=UPI0018D40180|nr:hypothetical protein [Bradyrhizobium sp. DOA1]